MLPFAASLSMAGFLLVQFMEAGGGQSVDLVTFHFYPMVSYRLFDPKLDPWLATPTKVRLFWGGDSCVFVCLFVCARELTNVEIFCVGCEHPVFLLFSFPFNCPNR